MFKNFVEDQKGIWTSPFHLHLSDTEWLVPLGGVAAAMLATDTGVSKHLSISPNRISTSNNLANYGFASLAATAGGMYVWGHLAHNDHMRETGFLAGEAAANALASTYALKYTLGRERPLTDNFQGSFWRGGDSFPSEHSSVAWSIAGIIAHEYPGPLTSVMSYGMAAAISASRITARQHFSSDVLIGSALGWFIGQEIYRHHHDPTLAGASWESYAESHDAGPNRPSSNVGSPYVELDSWIYPALERLVALGYIQDAFLGLRPWTRGECSRLLEEAQDQSRTMDHTSLEAEKLIDALQKEFVLETSIGSNVGFSVDSVYDRFRYIAGEPLHDGYDFAQTLINDYGRPYAEGANEVAGVTGWATAGPLLGYARVEYQFTPSSPALPLTARQAIQKMDFFTQEPSGVPFRSISRVDLLEGYVGLTFKNWQFTYGKQSEWWGPDEGGPMMFSDNAEPINMFRINRVTPFKLPSVLGWLGPVRVEFMVGQLAGHHFENTEVTGPFGSFDTPLAPQPFVNGQAFSFKPTSNLEFGFTRTTIFAGELTPFTPHKFLQSIFSLGNTGPGTPGDPGDRRSGFNLSYRLPWVRKWLSFYADGFTDDQISPVAYWDRSAWVAGLYFPQIPHIPKLDLRVEGVYTDLPIGGNVSHGFFYFNVRYLNGYTSSGNLIGSWIGRQDQGAQAWANYWLTPRKKLQFNFRHQKASKEFVPSGGTLTDAGVSADLLVREKLTISAALQYERWDFPIISAARKTNLSSSIQFTYWPKATRFH